MTYQQRKMQRERILDAKYVLLRRMLDTDNPVELECLRSLITAIRDLQLKAGWVFRARR